MKNPIVLGLVGEKGSGKETVAKLFIKFLPLRKIKHVKYSDLLKDTLDLWALPSTRANLQDLAIIMDNHYGNGTLANAIFHRIQNLDADIVILDGVRWDADIELINQFKKHYLMYITADVQVRFERVSRRIEKVGEGKDIKQFLAEEHKATEVNIPKLGENADFKIENNSGITVLKKTIKKCLDAMKL